MSRYLMIVYQNGIVKSIKIGTTSMRKAQEFVGCLNHHEVAEAIITDKEYDDYKTKEE